MDAFPALANQWVPWILFVLGAGWLFLAAWDAVETLMFRRYVTRSLARMSPPYRELAIREMEYRPHPRSSLTRLILWGLGTIAAGIAWIAVP
jgi:hypothetical protein